MSDTSVPFSPKRSGMYVAIVLLATIFLLLETFGSTMSVEGEQDTFEEEVVPSVSPQTIGNANKETTSVAELLEVSAPEEKLDGPQNASFSQAASAPETGHRHRRV